MDRWTTAGKQKAAIDRPLRAREHQVQSDTPSAFGTRRLGSRLARSAGLFQMRGPRKQYGRDRDETAPPRMTPGKARVTEGNRPERRSVGSGSLEVSAAAPGAMGVRGSPGYRTGLPLPGRINGGGTTLALATECLAIAAVGHKALSARRTVFFEKQSSQSVNERKFLLE